jgi:hypothetical protein
MNQHATLEAIVKDLIRVWDTGDMMTFENSITAAETLILGKSRVVVLDD